MIKKSAEKWSNLVFLIHGLNNFSILPTESSITVSAVWILSPDEINQNLINSDWTLGRFLKKVLFTTATLYYPLCSYQEHVSSLSGLYALAAAVDVTTLSPVSKQGAVDLSSGLMTLMLTFLPCLLLQGRSAQEEAERPGKWKDEEE